MRIIPGNSNFIMKKFRNLIKFKYTLWKRECLKCLIFFIIILLIWYGLMPAYAEIFNESLFDLSLNILQALHPLPTKRQAPQARKKTEITANPALDSLITNKNYKEIKWIIGPHNEDFISIIFGSLLGEGYLEKTNKGTRIIFYQEALHVKYLFFLHEYLKVRGYLKPTVPKIETKLEKGKVYKTLKFSTYTYKNLDWIYDLWYVNDNKIIPLSISDYLTPFALAIWIMDSSVKSLGGLIFISRFSYSECLLILQTLKNKYGIIALIQPTENPILFNIFISKDSIIGLKILVGGYLISEMKYKLLT